MSGSFSGSHTTMLVNVIDRTLRKPSARHGVTPSFLLSLGLEQILSFQEDIRVSKRQRECLGLCSLCGVTRCRLSAVALHRMPRLGTRCSCYHRFSRQARHLVQSLDRISFFVNSHEGQIRTVQRLPALQLFFFFILHDSFVYFSFLTCWFLVF